MNNTLALTTTDQKIQRLKMIEVSWVHDTADQRRIEISATNQALGQLQVEITTSGDAEDQERLSEFHDKLVAMMGKFDTQITAYTGTATLSKQPQIDLKTNLVYLILNL